MCISISTSAETSKFRFAETALGRSCAGKSNSLGERPTRGKFNSLSGKQRRARRNRWPMVIVRVKRRKNEKTEATESAMSM